MNKFIPLSIPNLKGNELKYVTDAVSNEWVSTGGSYVTEFEKQFAAYAGVDKVAACQSGTTALHLSLISCGIGAGDLVVAPTLTFAASVNPITYVGAARYSWIAMIRSVWIWINSNGIFPMSAALTAGC